MALFQLGEIDFESGSALLEWRKFSPIESLSKILERRIDEIKVSPRNRKNLFVLSMLVRYVAAHNKELGLPLIEAYLDACTNLVKLHEPPNGSTPKEAVADRVVQCLCLMHAISVFVHSDLVSEFLPNFFRTNIGIRQLLVYEQDAGSHKKEWTSLYQTYLEVIARSSSICVETIETNLDDFLPKLCVFFRSLFVTFAAQTRFSISCPT